MAEASPQSPAPGAAPQVCSECQTDQPAASFHRSKSYNDGLYGKCKRCCAAALSRRRASGSDDIPGCNGGRTRAHSRRSRSPVLSAEDIDTMLLEACHYGDDVAKVPPGGRVILQLHVRALEVATAHCPLSCLGASDQQTCSDD